MAVYPKIYKKLEEVTDENSGFYDFEVFELVKQEAQIIGRQNIENRSEHNWTLAKSDICSFMDLSLDWVGDEKKLLGNPEELSQLKDFNKKMGYTEYAEIAERLLQKDSQQQALI